MAARTIAAYTDLNCSRAAHAIRFPIPSSGNVWIERLANARRSFGAGGHEPQGGGFRGGEMERGIADLSAGAGEEKRTGGGGYAGMHYAERGGVEGWAGSHLFY